MKILIPAGIIILFFSISGCYYDSRELLYPQINTTCDTTNVTFSGSVTPILTDYCYLCHSNGNAASFGGGIKLQDYADIKTQALNGKLLGSIKHSGGYSPMPKGSSQQIESCKITIINIWVKAGEPNN